jgi:hypothetical protein
MMLPDQATCETRKNRIVVAVDTVFFIFQSINIFKLLERISPGADHHRELWSYVFEHGSLCKGMKVNVPPDRRFPVTINTDGFIARCPQKTGIGIPLDLPAWARFPDTVVPPVEGMTRGTRQITDIDFFPMVVKYLDIACGLTIEGEDIINQFPFWMGRHRGDFVFRHRAL